MEMKQKPEDKAWEEKKAAAAAAHQMVEYHEANQNAMPKEKERWFK